MHTTCWTFCIYVPSNPPSNPSRVGTIAFILQIKKLKLEKVEMFTQNHLGSDSGHQEELPVKKLP